MPSHDPLPVPQAPSPRRLRMLLFLDYDDGAGVRFVNSPGLLPLVGSTREAGFDVDFVTSEARLLALIEDPNVDVVGFSSMERLLARTAATARKVRAKRPDLVLMLGGNAIDPFAIELTQGLVDVVVLGEAEHVLPALLSALAQSRGLLGGVGGAYQSFVDGPERIVAAETASGALTPEDVRLLKTAAFRRSAHGGSFAIRVGGVFLRDSAAGVVRRLDSPSSASADPPVADLNLSSAPQADELDGLCVTPWDVFESEAWKHFEFYTQRGCSWGRCRFCSVADREIRALSPRKVAETVAEACRRGAEMISFADDLFVQKRAWNEEVLRQLAKLGVRAQFRAQTLANRSLWPLLGDLSRAGFVELAFGVETLSPIRAEAMRKSFDGPRYVTNAKETVTRTASHGIMPVLYMIMVDPTSTLATIADELELAVELVDEVYEKTGVVPKLSYSLMMLPVACTAVTEEFRYRTESIPLDWGELLLPTEFEVPASVACYLRRIDERTRGLPSPRENLLAMDAYLAEAAAVAAAFHDTRSEEIAACAERARIRLGDLTARLDREAERAAVELCNSVCNGKSMDGPAYLSDHRRFGGYVAGVRRFSQTLTAALEGLPATPAG